MLRAGSYFEQSVVSSFEYEMICEIPSEESWENMLFKRVVDVCGVEAALREECVLKEQ